jgi:hypothetical protein
MSTVTEAVRDYILPRLAKAERIVVEAQQTATPRQGYMGFDVALQTIRDCARAVTTEPTRDAAVTLRLLDTARTALLLTGSGDAEESAHEAIKLIGEASVIVTPTP